ncbi:tetratricopeptide repeat protein [Alphaproteobacteria bacterium]|nr:tetratricopeptide repeat protein [Alphaproteobacteria bacterium]
MSEIEEKRELGFKLFQEEQFFKCYEIFSYIIGKDDTDHNAWFFLGKCERRLNNYKEAIDHFNKAIKHFINQYSHLEVFTSNSNNDLRWIYTSYKNSLAVTYQYNKEWTKALDLFFDLLRGQANKDVLNSLGYTFHLMSEEEWIKNKNTNLAHIYNLQSLYFYEQADYLFFQAWKNENRELINEAIKNKTHSANWEKDFLKKRNEEMHQTHWYRTLSYNLIQKNLDIGDYKTVLELGKDALEKLGQTNDYFEKISFFVKEAKSKLLSKAQTYNDKYRF